MMGAVLGYQGTSFGKAQVEALANFYSLGMDEKVSLCCIFAVFLILDWLA